MDARVDMATAAKTETTSLGSIGLRQGGESKNTSEESEASVHGVEPFLGLQSKSRPRDAREQQTV